MTKRLCAGEADENMCRVLFCIIDLEQHFLILLFFEQETAYQVKESGAFSLGLDYLGSLKVLRIFHPFL